MTTSRIEQDEHRSLRSEVFSLLRTYGIRPRKGLGQNFLTDGKAMRRIIQAAKQSGEDTVIEVGPGLGVMTERLAQHAQRVVAIELDSTLADHLRERTRGNAKLDVVEGDILQQSPGELLGDAPYIVVGNLPYAIGAAVLRHFLESSHKPRRMIVMLQRQVADNVCATPEHLGILGISVQVYGSARILFSLKPGSFHPAPKVDSAVIEIDVFPEPLVDASQIPRFFKAVRGGFSAPRKQIRNSLAQGLRLETTTVEEWLRDVGIDAQRRPQTLTLDEWKILAEQMPESDR